MKWFFAVLASLFLISPCRADSYYFIIFSHDSQPIPMPHISHVWGTFTHHENGGKLVQTVTISWAPKKAWHITDRAKDGYDMTLVESIEDAIHLKRKVCMWGPFAIDRQLFDKAVDQHNALGRYKCIDTFSRPTAVNCIHRLSDITGCKLTTHFRYGKCAGNAIYKHYLKCGLIEPVDDNKVVSLLGVEKYHIKRIK